PAARWMPRRCGTHSAEGGYVRCNVAPGLPPRSPGSRTLYRGTGAEGARSSAGVAGRRGCPRWPSPLHVMTVCASYHDGQRGATLVGQRMALRAKLAAIGRIGACCRPPKGALAMTRSSDCQRHWMPRSSSYRVSSLAHNRSKTPAWTYAWNRRWHVEPDPYSLGKAFHC